MARGGMGLRRYGRIPVNLPILLFSLALAVLTALYLGWTGARNTRQEAVHTAEVYAARMESLLNDLFHKTDVLESVVISGGGAVSERAFLDLSMSLDSGAGIRAIQYLPGGVVEYCYPREGNEAALGTSVFTNPERREDAQLAVDTKEIALSGPYQLLQGGLGLVARNPIFLTDEDGDEAFWGFSVIILDLPEALSPIRFEELTRDGYEFSLSCTVLGEEVVIQQSGGFARGDTVDSLIHVPNHTWTLSLKRGRLDWKEAGTAAGMVLLLGLFCTSGYAQMKERQEILRRYAERDELTGLLNRHGLTEATDAWCRDLKKPFLLVYIDLDRFKAVNDTYGHTMGDHLLRETARRLEKAAGPGAVCGRIGGDEFVALTRSDLEPELRQAAALPFVIEGHALDVALSVGSARFPEEGKDYDELVKIADQRMYAEKRDGQNRAGPYPGAAITK